MMHTPLTKKDLISLFFEHNLCFVIAEVRVVRYEIHHFELDYVILRLARVSAIRTLLLSVHVMISVYKIASTVKY